MNTFKFYKILFLALLSITMLYFGCNYLQGSNVFENENTYYAIFNDSKELSATTPVFANGLRIGTIKSIEPVNYNLNKIIIAFALNQKYKIPDNSIVTIKSGLLGSEHLYLNLGNSTTFFKQHDTIKSEQILNPLESALETITPISDKIVVIISRLDSTLLKLNSFLNPTTQNYIENSLKNIEITSEYLNDLSKNIDKISQPTGSLSQSLSNVNKITANFLKSSDSITKIVNNTTSFTNQLKSLELSHTVNHLNTSLQQLTQFLNAINSGKGSLGKLATDTTTLTNLNETIYSLHILLDDIKVHPRRYISVFGKKDKSPPLDKPLNSKFP
ncbi:MAG: MlaD family protein [Alphaproteobacteria bacterium]|nr:MlaD family protein [Alphaproteobacteria bacterium]